MIVCLGVKEYLCTKLLSLGLLSLCMEKKSKLEK